MTARVIRTPEARADLIDIWAFSAEEFGSAVADSTIARLYGALEVLAAAPKAGRPRPEFQGAPRSFAVRPFIIFYEPLANDGGILVWRIIHGARDLPHIVKEPPDQ